LSGAEFFLHDGYGDYFEGRFEPGGLRFVLGSPYYYSMWGPDVVERVAPNRVLAIDGFTKGMSAVNGSFHSAFYGSFVAYTLSTGMVSKTIAYCQSDNHQFRLTPQTGTTSSRR
jgi:hypothetical protein